ncbi:MAG TPA: ABC transporter permease subunit [Acidobacteriaceae bacterium]|nr:ABC transporter permease subunit [Acidobacteriaceae bacterium]
MLRLPEIPAATRTRETLARSQVLQRTWPIVLDLCVALVLLAGFYALVLLGRYWFGHLQPEVVISQSPRALPRYAFYSVVRIGLAYLLSLVFAIVYGYIAANVRRLETAMIALLDVLQSIPVLSFLPPVMLAMVALFPAHQIGVEFGAILLIFTGQVWNLAFSFYSSLKAIPRELREAADIGRFSRLQRLLQLELPFAAIGLVWNSIMSVAGGWFFLMACEMFTLGPRDFRLPGLGSYLQTAAGTANGRAIAWGLGAMVAIIVATDQLIWRPVIAWSDKFKFELVETTTRVRSPLIHFFRRSNAVRALSRHSSSSDLLDRVYRSLAHRHREQTRQEKAERASSPLPAVILRMLLILTVAAAALYFGARAILMLREVHRAEFFLLLKGAAATFLRVNFSLILAVLWTVPVGVAIGLHPRLARIAQPLAQIAASVPATALFPVLLLLLIRAGGGMGIGAVALMLLQAQWYILFNVIAGSMAIPTDLREVATLFHFSSIQRWRTVILPAIFPYLLIGLVTASGGAWNASIIAEYFEFNGRTMQTLGLGAQISAATADGQFPILLLATILMALIVVTVNRLLWRRLFHLAETRYKLEG